MADNALEAVEGYKKWIESNLRERKDTDEFILMFTRYPEGMVISFIRDKNIIAMFNMGNDIWGTTAVLVPYESCSIIGKPLETE